MYHCTALLLALAIVAGESPPQVDKSEAYRRGDWVTVTGEGARSNIDTALVQATAPPPDDSYKWFITVIKTNNCQHCERLLSDFQKAPELLAFVTALEPYKAWAHYNVYNASDQTQAFRVKAYKVAGYPTIVIQPPRNGVWGDPRTVVWQATGYDGNPGKLAQQITAAVRRYAAKMAEKGYPKFPETKSPPIQAAQPASSLPEVKGGASQEAIGIPPPFATPPPVDPFNPHAQPSAVWPPPAQPADQPLQAVGVILNLLLSLLGSQGLGNLFLLIMISILILERISPRTETKLDDLALSVLKYLKNHIDRTQPPAQSGN